MKTYSIVTKERRAAAKSAKTYVWPVTQYGTECVEGYRTARQAPCQAGDFCKIK